LLESLRDGHWKRGPSRPTYDGSGIDGTGFAFYLDPAGVPVAVWRLANLPGASGDERPLLPSQDFHGYLGHMRDSMHPELVLLTHEQGWMPRDFRCFKNVASALAFAALLIVDPTRPYRNALCRCKLERCRRFYLAQKNLKGGPANRTYCSPAHRDAHHNSAERKAAGMNRKAKHK
jgi:hypothetical protein